MALSTVDEMLQLLGADTGPIEPGAAAQVSSPGLVDVVEEAEEVEDEGVTMSTGAERTPTPPASLLPLTTLALRGDAAGSAADVAYQKNGSVTSRPDLVEHSLSPSPKWPTTSAEEVTPTSDAASKHKIFSGLATIDSTKPSTLFSVLPSGITPTTALLPLAPRDLNAGTATQRNHKQRPLDPSDDVLKTAARHKPGGTFASLLPPDTGPITLNKSLLHGVELTQIPNFNTNSKGHGNGQGRVRQKEQQEYQGTKSTIRTRSAKIKAQSSSLPVPSSASKHTKNTTTTSKSSKSGPGIEKTLRALEKAERRHRDDQRREVAIWASEVARMGTTETDSSNSILADKGQNQQQQQSELKVQKKDGKGTGSGSRDQLKLKTEPSYAPGVAVEKEKPARPPMLGKLSFLGWARKASSSSSKSHITTPVTPNTPTSLLSSSSTNNTGATTPVDLGPKTKVTNNSNSSAPPPQPMSRNYITPQVDAPRGASNGTDRRVNVHCRTTKADLDVNHETSTVDILLAFCEHDPITVNASLLVESYVSLGLQRRLRRYERIWNVMNSWDGDSSNNLVIWPNTLKAIDKDLDLASVPHREPRGCVLSLYHSNKPGKWNKRYIILQEGGQVISSKNAEPGPSDKDVVNLCHLSDYDIYTPTEAQMKAQKFPRKYCYAIKSQEKKNIFVNSDNYVHYFSTSDPAIAQRFHAHIHAWRSWYMVHKMLELHKKKKAREAEKPPQIPLEDPAQYQPKKAVGHVHVNGHKVKVSVDESPYTIGAFAPLIDTQRFNKPLEEFGEDWEADERRKSRASQHSRTQSLPGQPKTLLGDLNPTNTFAANGLLGNAYAQRKQAQIEEERQRLTSQGSSSTTFSPDGQPTLLNGGLTSVSHGHEAPEQNPPVEKSWFPSALEHTAKQRSEQQRRPGSGPSISSATSSQHEDQQPDRRGLSSSGGASSGLQRRPTTSNRQPHSHSRPHPSQPQPLVTFTPTFVEAPQWSREGRGHGVKAPEGKPLVDFATGPPVQPHSRFTPAAPPQNLIRRGTQREMRRPPPLTHQRRGTESNEARPLISPTTAGPGSSSGLPTRRPTVTSTTSRSRRADPYGASSVSPTSPTAMVDPRAFPRSDNDRDDRPGTGGSSPGNGTYGYAPPDHQTRGRGYSRSASHTGLQQQYRHQQAQAQQLSSQNQAYPAPPPPRYLNNRGEPRSVPPVVPPAAATGAMRDPRELLLLQKQRERERGERDMDHHRGRELQRAPQPLGQRAPLRGMSGGDGYGRS
ncbi:hypothetical protein V8F20_004263 [Naviculisporaceae sp. PSN 640]